MSSYVGTHRQNFAFFRESLGVSRINHILRAHGHAMLQEQRAAEIYDEVVQRSLERLFLVFTGDTVCVPEPSTASDHWGLTATIRERYVKTLEKRHVSKPIGWECSDHIAFNNTVRTQLVECGAVAFFCQELRLSDNPSFALYIHTDGSARNETRTQKRAGWGFTAMTKRPRLEDKPMIEACGPVQISKREEFYIGATRATNNTAEMQGVIEVLFWLNSCLERGTVHADDGVLITVDSLYVKGLIDEKFIAPRCCATCGQ